MKSLRLAVPLVLAAFILTCQGDQTTAPDPPDIRFAPGGTPGPNPDRGGGKASFALSFDGTDGTETPDSDALDLTNTFTIEGWLKAPNPAGSVAQTILAKWGASAGASYGVAFERDGRLKMATHDPNATPDNSRIMSAGALQAGVWQHFAFVFDNGQAWLYVDGVLNSSCGGSLGECWNQDGVKDLGIPYLNTPQVTASILTLGRYKDTPPGALILNHYVGLLDEVRVWNVARTAKQIRQNVKKALNLRKANGLVAYWRMNEGSGQVAADASGNGHDMQLADSPADPAWVSPGKP